MNDYESSNRKKLRDLLDKINSETGLSMTALSVGIGHDEYYLKNASSKVTLHTNGDIKESTLNDIVEKLSNKDTIFMVSYNKSRCFKLKQQTVKAAKELNVSEGKISLLVSSLIVGENKATNHYLSNKMAKSQFSLKGDLDANEFNTLIRAIDKVVKKAKPETNYGGFELITQQASSPAPANNKKPTLLNKEQIAEKLKQYMGYSSALWVDGHLVLSESLEK